MLLLNQSTEWPLFSLGLRMWVLHLPRVGNLHPKKNHRKVLSPFCCFCYFVSAMNCFFLWHPSATSHSVLQLANYGLEPPQAVSSINLSPLILGNGCLPQQQEKNNLKHYSNGTGDIWTIFWICVYLHEILSEVWWHLSFPGE